MRCVFLLVKDIPKLHENIKFTGYVTFMATKMEVEFIKSFLQEVVFFKIALKYPPTHKN